MDNGDNVVNQNEGEQRSINISDVLDVISADPTSYAGGVDTMSRPPPPSGVPYVRIVEQPAGKALRFRYECEGRSAGSIPGANSKSDRKTYPTIEICGYTGRVVIVVSCVTRDAVSNDATTGPKYRPHPHKLVGRERCERGVCTSRTSVKPDGCQVSFSNLGIQCVKRKEIATALQEREELHVDPFKTGFNHKNHPQSIDLNAVRLCFQVFLQDEHTNKIVHALTPVVSDIIYDKKAMSDLFIAKLSHCSGPIGGGLNVILLCEKVTREDIDVVMVEMRSDRVVWEANAFINLVHKQVAIEFATPPYRDLTVQHNVSVYIQLRRKDNTRSNSVAFEYIFDPTENKKRKKPSVPSYLHYEQENVYHAEHMQSIKSEPERTPPHHVHSPPLQQMYSPNHPDGYQHWDIQGGMNQAGLPVLSPVQQSNWNYSYHSPSVQSISPGGSPMLPNMQLSPGMQMAPMASVSPGMQMAPMASVSPGMQMAPMASVSPGMQMAPMASVSPGMQMAPMASVSPGLQMAPMASVSPGLQMGAMGAMGGRVVSPLQAGAAPGMPHMDINPNHIQHQMGEQEDENMPSFGNLLADRTELQLNSADLTSLSGLSALLRPDGDLSDSLTKLSTNDLLR